MPCSSAARRGAVVRTHVEADDDGLRGDRQHDVRLGDGADARVDDLDLDLFVAQLLQLAPNGLHGALHVGLDDDVQVLHLALRDLVHEVVQRDGLLRQPLGLRLGDALLRDGPGGLLVRRHAEDVAGLRHGIKAKHADRRGGARRLQLAPPVVEHRPHPAPGRARHEDVAGVERAGLHQHGGHRAPAPCPARPPGWCPPPACRGSPSGRRPPPGAGCSPAAGPGWSSAWRTPVP